MAVKFSQFTTGSSLADIDYFVGYKGTDNIQVAKSLLSGTTYTIDVPTATTNINLAGSDSTNDAITLTQGANMTLTRTGAQEITFASAAGTTVVKDQFTGNNSTTAFTLSVTPTAAANLNIFISGVYQNSKDSGGTANYTVAGTTLTFATAPPTTAANGIEVVITQ